jgi:hypothetical protein
MYTVPGGGPWWHAVGPPLERRVRRRAVAGNDCSKVCRFKRGKDCQKNEKSIWLFVALLGGTLLLPGAADDRCNPRPTLPEEPIRPWQCTIVPPNVGAKGEADGETLGPDGRQCTTYLPAGPGGTPLDLPLSDGLGGAPSRTTTAGWPDALSVERIAKKMRRAFWLFGFATKHLAAATWLCLRLLESYANNARRTDTNLAEHHSAA